MTPTPDPDTTPAQTFLFSDIEGSTRLWEERAAKMQSALTLHDALARACVEQHGGRIVKTLGDGMHAAFEDPARAVAAALQLQLKLMDPAATDGLALSVRCGLHLGRTQQRGGDYYGSEVNRAARIMSIAHGGQTLLSQAVAERVGGQLPPGVSLFDLGRVRLRDLSGPERVHQLMHAGLRAQFPPLRSLELTPNNLAQQLNSFVGREATLNQARARLATSRLLTLLGMGGIGKSRLSIQLGAAVLEDFADGVWLIELAPLADGSRVPQTLAAVLGVKEEPGRTVTDSLLAYVRDKQVLFILDNCEHVVHACAELVKQLLQAGAGVQVVASSRTALQVAGELSYQVPTLTVPELSLGSAKPASVDELMRHEAVRLFVDRAVAAQPAFALTEANAAAVADICRRLDGIPLAIELAAARTRALSVQTISERLHDRFRLLVTRDQTVLPRQRTLRGLIDWSHELLPELEQLLFRRLAVFAGGWTVEAVEGVCAGGALAGEEVLELLTLLVEKSLVVMEAEGGRYRMLDTVRHYALEKLDGSTDRAATQTAHLNFYVAYAEQARPGLAGPEQGVWLARLDGERENFLSAHAWSEQAPSGDGLGVRLIHALRPYWIERGNLRVGLRLAEELLVRPGLQARDRSRCMVLFGAGLMNLWMGRHDQAYAHLSECLSIAREAEDTTVLARVLQPLGIVRRHQRDFEGAQRFLEEALRLARQQGEPRETASSLNALAILHRMQGSLDLAEDMCLSAEAIGRSLGDQFVIGISLLSRAMVLIDGRSLDPATLALREAAELSQLTASQTLVLGVVDTCAGLACALGRWSDAAELVGAAESLRIETGQPRDDSDEVFLAPRIQTGRTALGEQVFAERQALGRHKQKTRDIAWVLDWLAHT